MPELPEVETVRVGLENWIKGATVSSISLRREGLRFPFPDGFGQMLTGREIISIRRRAKYLLLDMSHDIVLGVHLGMTGQFRQYAQDEPEELLKHEHVMFYLADGRRMAFYDPRRFGMMFLTDAESQYSHPLLQHIGPEPLEAEFTGEVLHARLQGRKGPIKVVLLDQKMVAGVGNIYASEALYIAGIHPETPANKLTPVQSALLAQAIQGVMFEALAAGGSTLRDFRHLDGWEGTYQGCFKVYGLEGEACPDCVRAGREKSCKIVRIVQAGRSTFFCPQKQQ